MLKVKIFIIVIALLFAVFFIYKNTLNCQLKHIIRNVDANFAIAVLTD